MIKTASVVVFLTASLLLLAICVLFNKVSMESCVSDLVNSIVEKEAKRKIGKGKYFEVHRMKILKKTGKDNLFEPKPQILSRLTNVSRKEQGHNDVSVSRKLRKYVTVPANQKQRQLFLPTVSNTIWNIVCVILRFLTFGLLDVCNNEDLPMTDSPTASPAIPPTGTPPTAATPTAATPTAASPTAASPTAPPLEPTAAASPTAASPTAAPLEPTAAPNIPIDCYSGGGWGDPHLMTFDGLKFDCQALGQITLVKSMDSDIEVQARTESWLGQFPTVTEGIAATDGSRTIEVSLDKVNGDFRLYIDSVEKSIEAEGFLKEPNFVEFSLPTGVAISFFRMSYGSDFYLDFDVCIPKTIATNERIIGLLGSPNEDLSDDWMTRNGVELEIGTDLLFREAYEYCTTNWCVQDESDSLFTYYQSGMSFADWDCLGMPYDNAIETAIVNPPQCLLDVCGNDQQCIIDGTILGRGAAEGAFRESNFNDCLPTTKPCYFSCADARRTTCESSSGIFQICPTLDESEALEVYCDQETDGGGWMLLYSYKHDAGGSDPLEPDTIPLSPVEAYSHFFVNLIPGYYANDVQSIRFFCKTSAHNRIVHFKTDHPFIKDLAFDGDQTGNMGQYWDNYQCYNADLIGHNATLPVSVNQDNLNDIYFNDGGFHQFPFWRSGSAHWAIRGIHPVGNPPRFECDNFLSDQGLSTDTLHNVWVKITSERLCDNVVTGDVFATEIKYFNQGKSVPVGEYRLQYVDGCMKYSPTQSWAIHADEEGGLGWYLVGESSSNRIVHAPGTVGTNSFETYDECVAANKDLTSIDFTLNTESRIGIWLVDSARDNIEGEIQNPTWSLSHIGCTT